MKLKLATFMILMLSAVGIAQADGSASPFTRHEARELRSVWPTIREAENFDDINWRALGLAHAPGDHEARELMAERWGSLRRAARFDDINWRAEYRRR